MKELLMVFQFMVSQETYFTQEGIINNKIDGRISATKETLYFDIDGVIEEYEVTQIFRDGEHLMVIFKDEVSYGTLSCTPTLLIVDILTDEEEEGVDWLKVRYKVKKTNLK